METLTDNDPRSSTAIVTISDGVANGTREDTSGAVLAQTIIDNGRHLVEHLVVADEADLIVTELTRLVTVVRLVITTGGTGFGPRDVTPEATAQVVERRAAGLEHLMYARGISSTPMAALSRGIIGSVGQCLVVNLPGSPKGAVENLVAIIDLVPHVLDLLAGDTEHR